MFKPKHSHLDASAKDEIERKRQLINRIKANNRQKLFESNKEIADGSPVRPESQHTSTITEAQPKSQKNAQDFDRNKGVSDTDKMLFQKKFKNYLNHRQDYLDQARKRYNSTAAARKDKMLNIDTGQAEYYNQEEVLSNTGSDYQYRDASDMQAAYEQMTTGKKRKGAQLQLFHCELYQNEFRRYQFESLLAENQQNHQALLSKDRFLDYLFDQPIVMMLYSINPYQLGDQLAQFQTRNDGFMTYQEFSVFLLTDREPTFFDYSPQNLEQARKIGRGIKCAPIIAKWIDETGIFEWLVEIYKSIDMRGDSRVDRVFLAKKLRKQIQAKRITELEVIEIININKLLPLNRLLYEIEFEEREGEQAWSLQEFIQFLQHYNRRVTPEKDRLITKLIMAGKFDSSYVYILSQEALQFAKDVFKKTPKFAQYFVVKQKFLENLCKDPRYNRIKGMWVRSQSNRYVKKETFQDTLVRILAEGDNYLDIEEVLDFLSNRGRPKIIQYKVYIQNLQRQLAIIEEEQRLRREKYGENESGSSDQEFNQFLKKKRVQRKQQKLKQIRNSNNFDINKKFNVTIPLPFAFDQRDKGKKISIRERRIKQMLDQKQKQIKESMKPIKPKQVPEYVKENLYAKMLKDQQRQRKERLQKFKLEIMSQVHVSDRLMQPKSDQIHCDFSSPEYKFTARPMPWYCQVNLIDRINRKKQERREKILEEIITRNTDYDLPEGVQRMMEREAERQQKRAQKAGTASTVSIGECTFVPKISQGIPDFKTIHQHLHFDLQNAKNVRQPIKVMPFSFQNRPAKSRTTYEAKPLKDRQQNVRHSKFQKIDHEEQFQKIPKTQKFAALVQHRRRQQELKERKQEQQKRGEAVRKLRQSKFAPVVWRALKHNNNVVDPSKSRAIIAQRMKQFKRQERKKREQYENQMIRILTKVYQRPLLLESRTVQNQQKGKSPDRSIQESNVVRSKVRKEEKKNKQSYLQQEIYPKGKMDNLKLNLDRHNKIKQLNLGDDERRKVVEAHELGNYPADGADQQEYDEEDQDFDQQYEEQYEHGNLRTS